jgi:hypothetical protein
MKTKFILLTLSSLALMYDFKRKGRHDSLWHD